MGDELGLPVRVERALREVDVGEWSGLTTDKIEARYPGGCRAAARRRERLGARASRYEAMGERIEEALLEIAAAHPGATVLVVTHGGPIRDDAPCGPAVTAEGWHHVANCEVDAIAVREGRMRWIHSTRGGLHEQVQG